MWIDLSPLKNNKNYRYLFLGQFVSYFGTLITVTVIPIQVFQLTQSSAQVGLVSLFELIPMLLGALLGGALADHFDRKKLLIICESVMTIGVGILLVNSLLPNPSLVTIFVMSAILQAVNGFHRPAMDSLGQAILLPKEIPAAAALQSFKFGFVTLLGPSLGGILISTIGSQFAYAFDLITFAFSIFMIAWMDTRAMTRPQQALQLISSLREGIKYAVGRQEILGTYLIDWVAMAFAFPVALFPALSQNWQRSENVGFLYSALAIGSIGVPLISGWASQIKRQGQVIIWAAAFWGIGIILFGLAKNFWMALFFLVLAGIADTISGYFRVMIWNQTIPNQIRGRMAGLEMISYMSGPLLGNARAGWVASMTSNTFSLISGGLSCACLVVLTAVFLPRFHRYQIEEVSDVHAEKH